MLAPTVINEFDRQAPGRHSNGDVLPRLFLGSQCDVRRTDRRSCEHESDTGGTKPDLSREVHNYASDPRKFDVGERIAQLVFFPLDASSSGYDGAYQDQDGTTKVKYNSQ